MLCKTIPHRLKLNSFFSGACCIEMNVDRPILSIATSAGCINFHGESHYFSKSSTSKMYKMELYLQLQTDNKSDLIY